MPPKKSSARTKAPRDGRKQPIEKLVERVFMKKPRTLSFSHRWVGSLRHPYTHLVYEASLGPAARNDRVTYLLESFVEPKKEKEHWQRVERIFDSKLTDEHMEKMKLELLFSHDLLQCFEILWARIGGVSGGFLPEETYRQFQQQLYFYLMEVNDMALVPATMQFIQEDMYYDYKSDKGLDFAGFAASMLEVADNWTSTRQVADYVAFVQRIIEALAPAPQAAPASSNDDALCLNPNTFVRGGVVIPHQENGKCEYRRTAL